jgi:dihydroxyacetone kinase-like protein
VTDIATTFNPDEATRRRLFETVARRVIDHADELTMLDQAIGDGDHGLNMRRGFEAVLAETDQFAQKPLPDALNAIGLTLVMKVGGASGPLYGTLFMALAKKLPVEPSREEFIIAADAAIAAVKTRGKSDFGQKTMLDVLKPALDAFAAGRDPAAAAEAAAEATIPMRAVRGRASFLGDRSMGHMDPGARSSALIIGAVCEVVERA